ncbi:MAG TPA: PEP-utilizing enzyme [Chloroflexia bacterium]|nr:PEP-utilizing enzyme [Chloroflexia bacterium]
MVNAPIDEAEFPITWEDPTYADLQWSRDDMHCPLPLPPLAGDYMIGPLSEGANYYYKQTGEPVAWLGQVFNGYVYFATWLGVPESERPRIDAVFQELDRKLSLTIRAYWDNEVMPALRETYGWLRDAPVETASPAELADMWQEACKRVADVWGMHFLTVSGCYQCLDTLADLYESLFEGAAPAEALSLAQGHSGDLHKVESDLYSLTQQVRNSPALAQLLEQRADLPITELEKVEGGPEFLRSLQDFLGNHGHLGQPFDDLSYPSWEDEPELLMAELKKRLDRDTKDPQQLQTRLLEQADALAESTRARLMDRPEDLARFEEALDLARTGGSLTEDHNYWLDRMVHAYFHRFAVRIGARMVEAGVLAEARDIFFLHIKEIGETLRDGNSRDFRSVVAGRKLELEKQKSLRPPKIVGKPRVEVERNNRFSPRTTETEDRMMLKGTGACAGNARGTARVVLSPADFAKVNHGDILVCPASNPSWVPLYGIIGGLVTNTGGVLAHAAVTAREFGVPAVVGAAKATEIIRDGQTIEVDGAAGIVRLY